MPKWDFASWTRGHPSSLHRGRPSQVVGEGGPRARSQRRAAAPRATWAAAGTAGVRREAGLGRRRDAWPVLRPSRTFKRRQPAARPRILHTRRHDRDERARCRALVRAACEGRLWPQQVHQMDVKAAVGVLSWGRRHALPVHTCSSTAPPKHSPAQNGHGPPLGSRGSHTSAAFLGSSQCVSGTPHDSTPTASFEVRLVDLLWPQPPLT